MPMASTTASVLAAMRADPTGRHHGRRRQGAEHRQQEMPGPRCIVLGVAGPARNLRLNIT